MFKFLSYIWSCLCRAVWSILAALFQTKKEITLDTGKTVVLGKQIAEGGFSFVFECFDSATGKRKYALKRIFVGDAETLRACQKEAGVHRSVSHANVMPLLGICFDKPNQHCYMLFPFMPQSLRKVINANIFDQTPPRQPMSELAALCLFYRVCLATSALHDAGCAHCDIKLENILLENFATSSSITPSTNPVLMDFGSVVSPPRLALDSRSTVLEVVERASQHTTMPYRPPELLEGHIRAGDPDLDYTKVDVWSLGCTLFAILFGASPFECEFGRTAKQPLRIVDCTQLKIIGRVPLPPEKSRMAEWYSKDILGLVEKMLTQDRIVRPTLDDSMIMIEDMIEKLGGTIPKNQKRNAEDEDDLDALLSSNRFV